MVPGLSLLSSSSKSIREFGSGSWVSPFVVQDRVLFPDHVLLLVASDWDKLRSEKLDCVYHKIYGDSDENGTVEVMGTDVDVDVEVVFRPVLSVDEYEEFRSVVRCPLLPKNYSAAVSLQRQSRRNGGTRTNNMLLQLNRKVQVQVQVPSWETVAYAAQLDGDTVVVFVKGLNLRPAREHDPTQFVCHFGGSEIWEGGEEEGYTHLTARAITVAQEVVRCWVPLRIRKNPQKGEGTRVSVGIASRARPTSSTPPARRALPSVARLFDAAQFAKNKHLEKHELCVCTMVWNQASALREWVTYHAWLGVERWFVYDNNSNDGLEEVIEELEAEEYNVSRHTWPWIKTQEAGFSHCALRARNECKWVGFLDVDEFFYFPIQMPPRHRESQSAVGFPGQNSLRTLVANFSSSTPIAEIRTSCHSFGPSGLSSPPSRGVMAGYTCRLQSPERHKSIVRPEALDGTLLNVVHHFRLRKGYKYLNLPQSTAVINHYKYQVWETFRAKFFRRVATYVADWQENQNEGSKDRAPGLGTEPIEPPDWPLRFCEVWDTGLSDFVTSNLADPVSGLLPWEGLLQ